MTKQTKSTTIKTMVLGMGLVLPILLSPVDASASTANTALQGQQTGAHTPAPFDVKVKEVENGIDYTLTGGTNPRIEFTIEGVFTGGHPVKVGVESQVRFDSMFHYHEPGEYSLIVHFTDDSGKKENYSYKYVKTGKDNVVPVPPEDNELHEVTIHEADGGVYYTVTDKESDKVGLVVSLGGKTLVTKDVVLGTKGFINLDDLLKQEKDGIHTFVFKFTDSNGKTITSEFEREKKDEKPVEKPVIKNIKLESDGFVKIDVDRKHNGVSEEEYLHELIVNGKTEYSTKQALTGSVATIGVSLNNLLVDGALPEGKYDITFQVTLKKDNVVKESIVYVVSKDGKVYLDGEEPTTDEPTTEEPTVEEPTVEEPTVEEPTVEEPTVEEPTVEEPTVEEPVVETPNKDDTTEVEPVETDQNELNGDVVVNKENNGTDLPQMNTETTKSTLLGGLVALMLSVVGLRKRNKVEE